MPTPVTEDKLPDLSAVEAACATVGPHLTKGATFVLESTVYPGVTEDICGPALAAASGLEPGRDFRLGYSPERMNPGDRDHGLAQLTKVVAGSDAATTALLAEVYGKVTDGNVFVGPRYPHRRGRKSNRERPARHQHRLHKRSGDDLQQAWSERA